MAELLPPVDIDFELSNAENVAALRWHVLYTGGFRLPAPTGVAAAVLLAVAMRYNGFAWSWSLLIGACALLAAVLLVLFVFPWIAVLRSPQLSQHFHFTFTDRHIHYESDRQDGYIEWTRYDRFEETPDFYLLYYDDGDQFTVIPRRVFVDPKVEERFV
ncbi:MAG: YcxB family protein, partial [Bradymonadaceae bacterium]